MSPSTSHANEPGALHALIAGVVALVVVVTTFSVVMAGGAA
jgi:hypothetical protein